MVPFRNSKLTKILKRSLLKSNVSLIVCVSQAFEKYQETLTSLQFGARVYRKPTQPTESTFGGQGLIEKFQE